MPLYPDSKRASGCIQKAAMFFNIYAGTGFYLCLFFFNSIKKFRKGRAESSAVYSCKQARHCYGL